MLGLVYLTSVAGLIATSAVLHQLSLSRGGHTLLPPPTGISTTHFQPSGPNSEVLSAAQRPPCCILANKSLNCRSKPLRTDQQHLQSPPSASSLTPLLCAWGSLLASMGHVQPEKNSEMDAAQTLPPASYLCPGGLTLLPSLQCKHRNTSALPPHGPFDHQQSHAPWMAPDLLGKAEPSLNSHPWLFAPVQLGPCHPDSQALVMPG